MPKLNLQSSLIGLLMLVTALIAYAFRPSIKLADMHPPIALERIIPEQFGIWKVLPNQQTQIINPEQQQTLDQLYAQILNRAYQDQQGNVVLLSIAYGKDQSDDKQLHYPEVCYPAQGFKITSIQDGLARTDFGDIRVKKLMAELGLRKEPITYWTTVGHEVVVGGFEAKKRQLSYGFQGYIPDGLLFRVSMVTTDADAAYATEQAFISALMNAISPADRLTLAGLNSLH